MKNIKKWAEIFIHIWVFGFIMASAIAWFIAFVLAYMTEDKVTEIYINEIGEANIELFLATVTILLMPVSLYRLYKLYDKTLRGLKNGQ